MLSVILVRTVERAPTNLEATNARAVRDIPEGTVRQVKALTNASFLQGHPMENFEKKASKEQQSMNKSFWNHFRHFGRLLEKIYLFLISSKTDGRVPSQQGAPTTCNLTYWGVSQQTYVQALLPSWGVVIEQNSELHWGEGGWYKARCDLTTKFNLSDIKSPQPL